MQLELDVPRRPVDSPRQVARDRKWLARMEKREAKRRAKYGLNDSDRYNIALAEENAAREAVPQQAGALLVSEPIPIPIKPDTSRPAPAAVVTTGGSPYTKGNRVFSAANDRQLLGQFATDGGKETAFALIELYLCSFMLLRLEGQPTAHLEEVALPPIVGARAMFLHGLLKESTAYDVALALDDDTGNRRLFYDAMCAVMAEKALSGSLFGGALSHLWTGYDPDGAQMALTLTRWEACPREDMRHAMSHLLNRLRCCTAPNDPLRCAMENLDRRLGLELAVLPVFRYPEPEAYDEAPADEPGVVREVISTVGTLWRAACWTNRFLLRGCLYASAFRAGMQSSERWTNSR